MKRKVKDMKKYVGTKVNMEMYRFWYSKYFESVKMELEQKENKILGIKVK